MPFDIAGMFEYFIEEGANIGNVLCCCVCTCLRCLIVFSPTTSFLKHGLQLRERERESERERENSNSSRQVISKNAVTVYLHQVVV